ncbi:zinc ribbon domain-containing protein [Dysgonomonas macrotermitis]|uniref:Zinc-ribbon domain-containing protein n=1 Tax=Dysgonomonas macrotermitis TaxID=1346286 RepID=A0A1M5EZL0_9BACT|nr:zinc ribbon domain-containing protein [Dysgonomonas macrotermitis]SHF84608.1 hypothetical protein SAMN05444362_1113 [Dysgonomonas macrotermitis]
MKENMCQKCNTENPVNAKYCSGCGYELEKPVEENIVTPTISRQSSIKEKTKPFMSILGVVIGLLIMFAGQHFLFRTPSIDKIMMETASELNKSCPVMIDSETRLDNTSALPNNTFQYNYTLINWEKDSLDVAALEDYLEPNLINNAKTNPQMKSLRDNNVILNYSYRDRTGIHLFIISVKPDQYK